jgi:hypothetical protein
MTQFGQVVLIMIGTAGAGGMLAFIGMIARDACEIKKRGEKK